MKCGTSPRCAAQSRNFVDSDSDERGPVGLQPVWPQPDYAQPAFARHGSPSRYLPPPLSSRDIDDIVWCTTRRFRCVLQRPPAMMSRSSLSFISCRSSLVPWCPSRVSRCRIPTILASSPWNPIIHPDRMENVGKIPGLVPSVRRGHWAGSVFRIAFLNVAHLLSSFFLKFRFRTAAPTVWRIRSSYFCIRTRTRSTRRESRCPVPGRPLCPPTRCFPNVSRQPRSTSRPGRRRLPRYRSRCGCCSRSWGHESARCRRRR